MSLDQAVAVVKECKPVLFEIYKARPRKNRDRGQGRFSQLISKACQHHGAATTAVRDGCLEEA
eukprot:245187-Hanusia_phi.AAC.1